MEREINTQTLNGLLSARGGPTETTCVDVAITTYSLVQHRTPLSYVGQHNWRSFELPRDVTSECSLTPTPNSSRSCRHQGVDTGRPKPQFL